MNNAIFTIIKKELARFFGDRRMAVTTILLPGILIYFVYSLMGNAITGKFAPDEEYKPTVYAVNLPESVKNLTDSAKLDVNSCKSSEEKTKKADIENSSADLLLVFPENFDKEVADYSATSGKKAPNIQIYYNSSETNSGNAYNTFTSLLDTYESAMTNKFDINNSDVKYDLASDEDMTGKLFSSMLPMLLLIFMFSGCMAVAPESIAGEKERGTIATMLITPTKRGHIALGKIFALSVIAILSGFSSTIGTVLALPKLMGGAENGVVSDAYSVSDYAVLGVVILSTVLLLVTAVSIISAFAKTVKEAQTYVSPLMILTMLIGITAMFGSGIKTEIYYYLIPLYNSVQCMVGIFSFNIVPQYIAVTVISNIVYMSLGVFALSKMFNSEKIIFSR